MWLEVLVIHSVPFAAPYVAMLTGREVKISMASVGEPEENGDAERLMRTEVRPRIQTSA